MRPLMKAVLALAASASLAGCVSLLPKSKPALMYRFDAAEPAVAAAPPPAGRPVLGLGTVTFDAAASADRILTVTGQGAAFIAGARWVSPAPVLFQEALIRTFETDPAAPRLAERGGAFRAPALMSLDVQSFEARYDQGPEAAPLVVVRVHALLTSNQTRAVIGERTFSASVRATDNRQGPIVAAYQAAVRQVLAELVSWTEKP